MNAISFKIQHQNQALFVELENQEEESERESHSLLACQ